MATDCSDWNWKNIVMAMIWIWFHSVSIQHNVRKGWLVELILYIHSQPAEVMLGRSVILTTLFLGKPHWGSLPVIRGVHILLPFTDNCSSWISRRGRVAVEFRNIFMTKSSQQNVPDGGLIAVSFASKAASQSTELSGTRCYKWVNGIKHWNSLINFTVFLKVFFCFTDFENH